MGLRRPHCVWETLGLNGMIFLRSAPAAPIEHTHLIPSPSKPEERKCRLQPSVLLDPSKSSPSWVLLLLMLLTCSMWAAPGYELVLAEAAPVGSDLHSWLLQSGLLLARNDCQSCGLNAQGPEMARCIF